MKESGATIRPWGNIRWEVKIVVAGARDGEKNRKWGKE